MKEYKYIGKSTMSFSLNDAGTIKDHTLIEGQTFTLPSENDHIKTLLGRGLIEEVKQIKNKI